MVDLRSRDGGDKDMVSSKSEPGLSLLDLCDPKNFPKAGNPAKQAETCANSIGSATIDKNGVIKLDLRGATASHGMAELTYKPGDPQYKEVQKHLGPMKPGEKYPVKPWD